MELNKYIDINGNEMFPNDRFYLISALSLSNAPYKLYGDTYRMKVSKEEAIEWIDSNIYSGCQHFFAWCVISNMKTGEIMFSYFAQDKTTCLPEVIDEF